MHFSSTVSRVAFGTAALAALFAALVFCSPSETAAVQPSASAVKGGKTVLKPTARIIKELKRAKVRVSTVGSTRGGPKRLVFPITGGRIVKGEFKGKLRHRRSGLRLSRNGRVVALKSPLVDLGRGVIDSEFDTEHEDLKTRLAYGEAIVIDAPLGYRRIEARLTRRTAKALGSLGLRVKPGQTFAVIQIPRIGEEVIVD